MYGIMFVAGYFVGMVITFLLVAFGHCQKNIPVEDTTQIMCLHGECPADITVEGRMIYSHCKKHGKELVTWMT